MRRALVVGLSLVVAATAFAADDAELARLRAEHSKRFTDPTAALALAKYLKEHGDPLRAFYLCEDERKAVGDDAFDVAFDRVFWNQGPEDFAPEAEAAARAAFEKTPGAWAPFERLQAILLRAKKRAELEEAARRALAASPGEFRFVDSLADALEAQKRGDDAAAALEAFAAKNPDSAAGARARVRLALARVGGAAEKDEEPASKDDDAAGVPPKDDDKAAPPAPKSDGAFPLKSSAAPRNKRADEALDVIREAVAKFSDDSSLALELGSELWKRGDLDAAEPLLLRGLAGAKNPPASLPAGMGHFYLKGRDDPAKALPFYLDAYFISPHAYETEFVEFRVKSIAFEAAKKELNDRVAAGEDPVHILRTGDVLVSRMVVDVMSRKWRPEYVDVLLEAEPSEDRQTLHWIGSALCAHLADCDDAKFRALLTSPEPRIRVIAAAVVAFHAKPGAFEAVAPLLDDETELVRIRMVVEFKTMGYPKTKAALRARREKETCPEIKKMLEGV